MTAPDRQEAGVGVLFTVTTAVAFAVFLVRVGREPRRLGNAVWLGVAILSAVLLLIALADRVPWLGLALRIATGVLVVAVSVVLPVALIVNGVLMWQRERRRLANLLSLLAGLGLAGCVAVFTVIGPDPGRWVGAAAASVGLVVAYVVFLALCLLGYALLYGRLTRPRRVAAIVVPGAGLRGEAVPPLLASRLDAALRLYRRAARGGRGPVLVVSGASGPGESTTEAAAMRAHLLDAGVPADRVLLEEEALTTEDNLRLSADLLTQRGLRGRIVAVTNNYHVFRTAVIARRRHLDMAVVGAPTAMYFLPSAFLRELVALLAHYRRTNVAALVVLAIAPWVVAFS